MAAYDDMTPREREIFGTLDIPAQAHPVVIDGHGVARFRADPLLRHLVDCGMIDLNRLWLEAAVTRKFGPADLLRFYRNIGYSVGGYDEILANEYCAPALEDHGPDRDDDDRDGPEDMYP